VAGAAGGRDLARLGCGVTGFDVRPWSASKIESLGANWLDLGDRRRGDRGRLRAAALGGAAAQQQEELEKTAAGVRRRDLDGADPRPPGRTA
jgi:NAD(P) transhydrogenase subunit alpha